MSEIVYSTTRHPLCEGRIYSNPRFFTAPVEGVSRVLINGDWPKIEAAYRSRGVSVQRIDPPPAAPEVVGPPPELAEPLGEEDRDAIEIPADWQELTWPQLRKLAANFAPAVLNKTDAAAAVEAELARRECPDVGEPLAPFDGETERTLGP